MCVGLPARVVKVHQDGPVDASGAKREVSAELLDELDPGDYVMVHAGMAIARINGDDEEEMDDIRRIWTDGNRIYRQLCKIVSRVLCKRFFFYRILISWLLEHFSS